MTRHTSAVAALAGLAAFTISAPADATHMDQVNRWLSTESVGKTWQSCATPPTVATSYFGGGSSSAPYFKFNGKLNPADSGDCWEIGPFSTTVWGNPKPSDWWVQLVSNLYSCSDPQNTSTCGQRDFIRVCSVADVLPPGTDGPDYTYGPCMSQKGVGPGGCEVCGIPAP